MKQIKKLEDNIIIFCKKNTMIILFFLVSIVSLIIKIKFLYYKSYDYEFYLANWIGKIRNNGGIEALKDYIGDYNVPYMVILLLISYLPVKSLLGIKFVSIIFDYIMGMVVMFIIYELFKDDKRKNIYAVMGYIIVALLPTVILNSSAWAQCDSIYTTFVLISILFLIKEKNFLAFVFLGIAFSFKLQAILIFPVFILVYLSKKNFSIFYFCLIPIVNIIMCLPAIWVGKNVFECFSIYLTQTQEFSEYITMNFPSIYCIFFNTEKNSNFIYNPIKNFDLFGTFFTMFCWVIIFFIFINKDIKLNNKKIIKIALLSIMFSTFMLPHMHDRYLYLADIISVLYLLIEPNKFYITFGIQFISLYTYICYLSGNIVIPIHFVTIFFAVEIYFLIKDFVKQIREDNVIFEKKE